MTTESSAATETGPPAPEAAVMSTRSFVGRQISRIQAGYTAARQTSGSRADLARLRRGLGRSVGDDFETMQYTVNETAPRPRSEAPTWDENAIHTAMTLYAVHQQSQHKPMHVTSTRFGTALGRLRFDGDAENPGVLRRFQALGTATDLTELSEHARALIGLLRSAGIGFDYGGFADDLVAFQNPRRIGNVRLAWGRDFYRVTTTTTEPEEQQP